MRKNVFIFANNTKQNLKTEYYPAEVEINFWQVVVIQNKAMKLSWNKK